MFVTVDILGYKKQKTGDRGRIVFTASLWSTTPLAIALDHSLWQTAKQKNNYKNVEILWPKKAWREIIVGGPLRDGEKKQKKRGVYRVDPGVFCHPSRRTQISASIYAHYT